MDISVLVLTYNQKETVSRALDSILSQKTDTRFEIILSDDASTDGTQSVCEKYASKFPDIIKFIRREKNLGIIKNYYDTLSKARGKYITDLAGDDFWTDPLKLQKQFEILEQNPEVTLVSGEWQSVNENTGELKDVPNSAPPGKYPKSSLLIDMMLNTKVVNLSSSLYRGVIIRDMIRDFPEIIYNSSFAFEDLQILLSCAKEGDIVVLPGVVLNYSIGHQSVSHPRTFKQRFLYSTKATKQWICYRDFFLNNIESGDRDKLNEFLKTRGDYLYAMAYKAGPSEFETIPTDNLKELPYGTKGFVYSCLMRSKRIWRISRNILKRLFPDKLNDTLA